MFRLSQCTCTYQIRLTILLYDIPNDFSLIGITIVNIDMFRFLKQVKRNIAEEKDLMKDYPGWKVGTYLGKPIYKTVPEDEFIEPDHLEYFIHSHPNDFSFKTSLALLG